MIRIIAIAYATLISAATAQDATVYVHPKIPTEEEKILALKQAYELNGYSMVGRRMIDLSGPVGAYDGQLRTVPIEPPKQERRR